MIGRRKLQGEQGPLKEISSQPSRPEPESRRAGERTAIGYVDTGGHKIRFQSPTFHFPLFLLLLPPRSLTAIVVVVVVVVVIVGIFFFATPLELRGSRTGAAPVDFAGFVNASVANSVKQN
ncbi:hypothetical protein NL676_035757 [Syzygium grande]|nr:hypothetical protein NL676_035757 [Syzygium grande]